MSRLYDRNREAYEPSRHTMRATGNLTYLEFIALVRRFWAQAHPEYPLTPMGDDENGSYPKIVYSLELRKAHSAEPKQRPRETRFQGTIAEEIMGQRFQNIINFKVMAREPEVAEELIELFEDFMLEYTDNFKELGASDIFYGRRMPDNHESRQGIGVSTRTVSYMVILERIVTKDRQRLEEITISARTWLESADNIYSSPSDRGSIYDTSPRYYLFGSEDFLSYTIDQEDIDEAATPSEVAIKIPKTNFRIGDRLYLMPFNSDDNFRAGFYLVSGYANYSPYTPTMSYTLVEWRTDGATPSTFPIEISASSTGSVYYFNEELQSSIMDTFSA